MQIFPVNGILKKGNIQTTDKEAIIEDKETYFDIFKTIKKTTSESNAQSGAIPKK